MNNPKISIITISYNNKVDIEDTIKSIVNQKYLNKEYLIIDGGSKDGTLNIINNYCDKIDYFVSEPDRGISDAFNKGIKAATGDYIVLINAGDMLTKDALQDFADEYQSGYDVIKGNTIRWNPNTNFSSVEKPVTYYSKIPFNFLICHQSTYISKVAYEKIGGYNVKLKIVMDFDMMLRLTNVGMKFYHVDKNLAIFRMGGLSQQSKKVRIKEMKFCMENNGRNMLQTFIFTSYVRTRTIIRNLLDRINPDLKNIIITNKIK